ncbi:MAG: DUF4033 domain-containing protein [Synechococcales cyanobacterium CRU_2_2]|nr:DUF4033 domain-containing protein [Synechococcales cyanobacterium CRU_2_2]
MDSTKTIYHDSWLDRQFIGLFSRKMAQAAGVTTPLSGYAGFVALSMELARGRTAQEQRSLVGLVLRSLVPAPITWAIRTGFPPTRWVCEANAWFASKLFVWLIGPCDWVEAEITTATGATHVQRSGVHIQKCRYLEEAGCVGTCINLCKLPTQTFFTEDFGIPFTMKPNFEDLSCEMIFGQIPPALETEDIYTQPCLADRCSLSDAKAPACPKIDC